MELNLNSLLWDAIMNLCATGEKFDHWNFSLVLRVEINNVQFNGDLYSHRVCTLILYHTEQLTIKKYFFTKTSAIKLEFYLYISLGTIFLLPSPLCEKYVAWGDQAAAAYETWSLLTLNSPYTYLLTQVECPQRVTLPPSNACTRLHEERSETLPVLTRLEEKGWNLFHYCM